MSSVNKYKIPLEPAKHINERVRKLLHPAVGAHESTIENRTRSSKIKDIGILSAEIIQSQTITSFCTTKITNQITITTFYMAKQSIKSQIQVSARISPVQLRINCIPRNQSNSSNFAQRVINRIWTGLFANLKKRLEGPKCPPPPPTWLFHVDDDETW